MVFEGQHSEDNENRPLGEDSNIYEEELQHRENDSCLMMFEDSSHSVCTDLEGKKGSGYGGHGRIIPF